VIKTSEVRWHPEPEVPEVRQTGRQCTGLAEPEGLMRRMARG
jgi:hypothetical protein